MKDKPVLRPFEVCEFADQCPQECWGKDATRDIGFSCGLRRFIIACFDGKWPTKSEESRNLLGTISVTPWSGEVDDSLLVEWAKKLAIKKDGQMDQRRL